VVITHGGNLFHVARESGRDWREFIDFSASINPLGPSPLVRDAIIDALGEIVHYPDPGATRLKRALAHHWNIDADCILVGNGATELIHFLARTWPQQSVALVVPTFSEFHRAYPGAALFRLEDPQSWPDDGLLVVTNPNNPTGKAAARIGRRGPVLIDESFIEFSDLPSAIGSDCIILRSLTKFQALPGLRAGALVAPAALVRRWQAGREPWQVNVLAETAALACLSDPDHANRTRAFIFAERQRLWYELQKLPETDPVETCANFYFVHLTYSASKLCRYMKDHQVLLRNCTGIPGVEGQAIRFAIRTREENDLLLRLWRNFPCD
jgi:threonine-phosphate decarboxylase